jgi:N-acetyl-anhydromuramyl-L-alanine amidase AmpD
MWDRRNIILGALLGLWLPLAGGCTPPAEESPNVPGHSLGAGDSPRPAETTLAPAGRRTNIDLPSSMPRRWRYIVIHHSASEEGSAQLFDADHRKRGWDELGYHFVIDNGQGGADGRIEVGGRWKRQKWGAHAGGTPDNEYNTHGIGICVVGTFGDHMPSAAQMESLKALVADLANTYDIPPRNVIGHRDVPNAHTECPGERLWKWVHEQLQPELEKSLAERRRPGGKSRAETQATGEGRR